MDSGQRQPHHHADLIKAWADGAKIQFLLEDTWVDCKSPLWLYDRKYRIKPEEFDWVEFDGKTFPIVGEKALVRIRVHEKPFIFTTYAIATVAKENGRTFFEMWDDNFSSVVEIQDVTHWKLFSPHPDDEKDRLI